jgi:flagellar M-ring protein FliF
LFLDIGKVVCGLVVLLVLVLSVLRPLVKNLIGPATREMQVQVLPREAPQSEPTPQVEQPQLPSAAQQAAITHEQQVMQARTLVSQDPKRVAQVVRGWVAKDD